MSHPQSAKPCFLLPFQSTDFTSCNLFMYVIQMSAFYLLIPSLLPHSVNFVLNNTFNSDLLNLISSSTISDVTASFASMSAFSFPSTPLCAGTHINTTLMLCWLLLKMSWLISSSRSCLHIDFPLWMHASEDIESEQMITLLGFTSSTHCKARIISNISAVKMAKWSVVLF